MLMVSREICSSWLCSILKCAGWPFCCQSKSNSSAAAQSFGRADFCGAAEAAGLDVCALAGFPSEESKAAPVPLPKAVVTTTARPHHVRHREKDLRSWVHRLGSQKLGAHK